MIARIGHVKIAVGIERDAPRIAELTGVATRAAQNFHRLIAGIENLDAAVAEFTNELQPAGINADIVGITHFTFDAAGLPVSAKPFAVGREDLNAMIAGIGGVYAVH